MLKYGTRDQTGALHTGPSRMYRGHVSAFGAEQELLPSTDAIHTHTYNTYTLMVPPARREILPSIQNCPAHFGKFVLTGP